MTPFIRILIAEPNPDACYTLQTYLQNHGHKVQITRVSKDIVSLARHWQPNIILVSTNFTEKPPQRICQTILEDPRIGHIPIFLLQHINNHQVRLNALELGVSDILAKPIDLEELLLRVESIVRLSTFPVPVY